MGVPDWSRKDMKKTSYSKPQQGVRSMGSLFHGPKGPVRLADGGDVSEEVLKQEGLKASSNEDVGFFARLKAGNIDEAGSEANMRFGSGRGNTERQVKAAQAEMDSGMYAEPMKPIDPPEEPKKMTAADFQMTDKDTTPVPMPSKPTRSRSVASKPAGGTYDQSPAETARLSRSKAPDEYANETARLNRGPVATDRSTPSASAPASGSKNRPNPTFSENSLLGVLTRAKPKQEDTMTPAERSLERGRKLKEFFSNQFKFADGGMVKGKKRKC